MWFIGLLTLFYLFFDTTQQVRVFRAGGDYEDFLQSGMYDFHAVI